MIPETDAVRLARGYARQEAEECHDEHVITAHLLVGLLKVPHGSAEKLLLHLGVDDIQGILACAIGKFFKNDLSRGIHSVRDGPRVLRIQQYAQQEARQNASEVVTTAHYLVGCLVDQGDAAQMLNQFGVNLEAARLALHDPTVVEADAHVDALYLQRISSYKLW